METTIISSALFLLSLLAILVRSQRKRLSLPPGPKSFPLVGCLPQMLFQKPVFRWVNKHMDDMNTEVACFRFANTHVFVVRSPELACEFFKKEDSRICSRPTFMCSNVISGGYLTTLISPIGEQWKKMRKMISSELLSSARHQWLHDKRTEEADNLVRYVYNGSMNGGGIMNLREVTRHYCGNVTRNTMFSRRYFGKGREDGGPGAEEKEHVDSVFGILAHLFAFCVSDYLPFLKGFDLDGHKKNVKEAVRNVRKYQDPIVEERVKQWRDGCRTKEEDLLDVMICLKDSNGSSLLSAEEIKAQLVELMIATLDNPSNCIEWAMAEMLNKPELLKKATQEIDNVVGRDRLVAESDLPQLNYVKACAREAFRLHPILPFNVPHVAITDTIVSGYTIPKGSHVLLSRPGLGRNPRIWEKPLEFIPERHLKDKTINVILNDPELNMFSFSIGRRGCPGLTLGTTITTMLLSRLLQGFSWSAPPGIDKVELKEAVNDLFMFKPLLACAKPRLAPDLYPKC